MAKGRIVFRATARGARRSGFGLSGSGRQIQRVILDLLAGEVAPRLTRIYRGFAPHRSGRLERGLVARVTSRGGRVGVVLESTGAVSDQGYGYLGVTRFGHRKRRIVPRSKQALAFTGKGGRAVVVRSTRGYHPSRDWVADAGKAAEAELDRAERELGRRVERAVL